MKNRRLVSMFRIINSAILPILVLILFSSCAREVRVRPEADVKNLLPKKLAVEYLQKVQKESKDTIRFPECDFQYDYIRGWDLVWWKADYNELSYSIVETSINELLVMINRTMAFCTICYDVEDLSTEEMEKIATALESLGVERR